MARAVAAAVPPSSSELCRTSLFPRPLLCRAPRRQFRSPSSPRPLRLFVTQKLSTFPLRRPTPPEFDVPRELSRLEAIRSRLRAAGGGVRGRLRVLDSDPRVKCFAKDRGRSRVLEGLGEMEVYLVKCLVAAGQEHVLGWEGEWGRELTDTTEGNGLKSALYVLAGMVERWGNEGIVDGGRRDGEDLRGLLKVLADVEQFYDCIGGIIGYQIMVLGLHSSSTNLSGHNGGSSVEFQFTEFHVPLVRDLSKNTEDASQAALWGIEGLPKLGEIYPLGGAGDRLGLVDHGTGECLPAAMLPYCGRTLLEGLLRDLQAREFLYYKIYMKQCTTPVAIMTSAAKDNHMRIKALCERLRWFGRGRHNFKLFEQPLVPVVDAENGKWLTSEERCPVCKPGGHGVIWKLAHDKGIFKWFYDHGRTGATVRQISNVVAATDVTLLALAGIGLHHKKKLGFASCQRSSGATEGINVLMERKNRHGQWEYGITCVEYTEFEKLGIECASTPSQRLSEFPANTNILYVDLPSIEKVGSCKDIRCLPGMVLNLKKPVKYVDSLGFQRSVSGGRLECTMQSIADNFTNSFPSRSYKGIEEELDTFIVYNERKRVTSSAKKKRRSSDKSLHQTPDGSLLDILRNAYDILSCCNVEMPKVEENNKYLHSGPPFLVLLHPALGPIWEVIRQKFNGGSISEGSELEVEVAEFLWQNVQLDGSLTIFTENVMGSTIISGDGDPLLQYGLRCGRCKLQNVKVRNKGIDWNSAKNVYWEHDVQRFEAMKIILHGNAEFEAKDVTLEGNLTFEVPSGYRMRITASSSGTGFSSELSRIEEAMMDTGSWFWKYKVEGTHIKLEMAESRKSSQQSEHLLDALCT